MPTPNSTTERSKVAHTPGPWRAFAMVHEDTNKPMTPEQVGEYVCNSVKKSAAESGRLDFLFISAEKPDGPADVCHVGNGPTSPANAVLIAAAPDMLQALRKIVAACYRSVYADDARPRRPRCRFCEHYKGRSHDSDCVMGFVNEAIARAKGKR